MNRSLKFVNQGLAALLVLVLALPFTALAATDGKKTHKKQTSAKTTTPSTTSDQQKTANDQSADKTDSQTDAKTVAKNDVSSDAKTDAVKPSTNDETAPPITTPVKATQDPQQQSGSLTSSAMPTQRSAQQPPEDRVGVDLNNQLNLSIHDAVVMALNKNLNIAVNRVSVEMAEYNVKSAQGFYDVSFTSQSDFISQIIPTASQFSGVSNGSLTQKELDYNAGISQSIQRSGGSYTVQWNNDRVSTNGGSVLNPSFNNGITFNIRQPLMRNLKIDSPRETILIAKKNLDLSDVAFKLAAITTINQVEDAYWNLVFAIKNEDIQRDAVDLAVVQLENNEKQVAAGSLAPIDVISARVQVDSSINGVIGALQQVSSAENSLKQMLTDDPADKKFWSARIIPTTPVDFQPLNISIDDAMRLALTNRPELEQAKDNIALNDIRVRFFKDQVKPEIDLIGKYATNGLAGSALPETTTTNSTDILFAQELNKLLAGQPGFVTLPVPNPVIVTQTTGINTQFIGSQLTALENLFSNSNRTYEFGVSISFPFRNRTAKANLGQALANGRQLDLLMKQEVAQIEVDVRNALQNVESARQSIDAAKSARVNAEAQLAGEEQKFKAGLSQNFLVLQRQNDLSTARGNELRALTNYNIAVADLQRVLSITLDSAGVAVQSPSPMSDYSSKPVQKPDQTLKPDQSKP